MTDKKDLNQIGELKAQLNTPKTETRIILNDWQTEVKKSKLSPAARQKVVNHNKLYQSQNQESYGPCSYSGCDHKGVPFDLTIGIQGCKWWARGPNSGTSLPGYWERSPTGSYYWKEQLWLSHIGHAYEANSLMGPRLYVVNTAGLCAVEDSKFCDGARNLIQEAIDEHSKKRAAINLSKTLPSFTTGFTKWGIRTAVAVGSAVVPGATPLVLATVGGASWVGGKVVQSACDSDKAKHAWGMVSDAGFDTVKGVAIGEAMGKVFGAASSSVASQGTKLIGHEAAREIAVNGGAITDAAKTLIFTGRTISIGQKVYKIYDAFDTYGRPIVDASKHQIHVLEGKYYQSDCKVCSGEE
jgi:hypothetical protein